jgi:hypothetical protein
MLNLKLMIKLDTYLPCEFISHEICEYNSDKIYQSCNVMSLKKQWKNWKNQVKALIFLGILLTFNGGFRLKPSFPSHPILQIIDNFP